MVGRLGSADFEAVSRPRAGGQPRFPFGGANGDEPALHCPDPTSLAAVYQSVINRYNAKGLDFDIEGDKVLDQASIQRRNLALVALRVANPGLTISYTLQVLPSGLDDNGVGVLTSAKRDGFNPDVVNVDGDELWRVGRQWRADGAGRTHGDLEHSAAGEGSRSDVA